jgi:hypothetical protein
MNGQRSTGPQILLRLIAIGAALTAIVLTYEGFEGAWDDLEAMWALPVALAVVALGLMLWDEETSAARAERVRSTQEKEKLAAVQTQRPHGTPPDDSTI